MARHALRSLVAPVALLGVVGAAVDAATGCSSSGSSKPAICSSVQSLKSSVHKLSQVTRGPNALNELKTDLKTIRSDFHQVTTDAKGQYSAQTDAIKTNLSSVGSSVTTVASNPSANNIAAVTNAVSGLQQSVSKLAKDVSSTC